MLHSTQNPLLPSSSGSFSSMSLSSDPLSRPPSHTTLRQALAKMNGTTHFQIASNAMAPPAPAPRPSSAQHHRRGRSPTRKHLWTYSPLIAKAEADEEERLLREERAWLRHERQQQQQQQRVQYAHPYERPVSQKQPHILQQSRPIQQSRECGADVPQQGQAPALTFNPASAIERFETQRYTISTPHKLPGTAGPSSQPQVSVAPPLLQSRQSHARTPTQMQWSAPVPSVLGTHAHALETIPSGTSLVPILGRPPALIPSPTSLERAALESSEVDESEVDLDASMRYLRPPPSESALRVLYTRSQLPWIDEASRHLWHALHHFQAVTDDYAGDYAASAAAKLRAKNVLSRAPPHSAMFNGDANAAACPFAAAVMSADTIATASKPLLTSARIRATFNWSSLTLPLPLHRTWYGVSFRSIRSQSTLHDTALNDALYTADRLSHEEAVGAPGAGGLLVYWYGVPAADTGANLATCIWTSRRDAIVASRLPMHGKAVRHAQGAYATFELTRYKIVKRAGDAHLHIEEWDEVEDLPW